MPSASWKGYLKLSLVSCAVALYPAVSGTERTRLHNVNRATGNRLRMQMVDASTGDVVETEDRVRGYEVGKHEYVLFEEEDFDKVVLESTHTIDIDRFVPRSQVDPIYLGGSHYVAPDDKVAYEAFGVIREAMRSGGKVGIARVVMTKRERLVMLEPRGKGMLATTLKWGYEVRDDREAFDRIDDAALPAELVGAGLAIVDAKVADWNPKLFTDRYEESLRKLIKAKQAGQASTAPKPKMTSSSKIVNLMDALRRSIETEKAATAGERKPAAKSKAKSTPVRAAARGRK